LQGEVKRHLALKNNLGILQSHALYRELKVKKSSLPSPADREFEIKGTVLVVDDTELSLEMLSDILIKDGFKVQTAKSGRLALEAARTITPDLILLDIMMPGMDGYTVCSQLKKDELTRDVPVIFISAMDKTVDRVRCFEAGGVDFISKPFQVEEVLARMRTHLVLRRIQTRLEKQKAQLEQEISERKKAEHALQESEQRLQSILDNSPAVIYVKDTKGRYMLINRSYEELLHVKRDLFVGKRDQDIFPGEVAEVLRGNDQAVVCSGRAMQVEEEINQKDGLHSYISVKFPLRNVKGKIYALCGISSDITNRKHAERTLQKAKEAAEAANIAKSRFFANMSHELRTPLNVILGFSQLMQHDATMSIPSKKHLDSINRSGEHLLGLINNVLEVSKIEAGRTTLNRATFDLYGLLEDIEAMFVMRAAQKGVHFNVERPKDLPRYLVGDEGKLRQVLINLLGNAVKFTDEGNIILRVLVVCCLRSVADNGDRGQRTILFEVEDTGVGIAATETGKLFQPFEQTLSGQTKGGTGLGLAISREYAYLMGGDLTARSEPDKGSVFSLSCRLEEGGEESVERGEQVRRVVGLTPDTGPKTILLVDDNEENRRFVAELLSLVGFATWEATNGEEALAVFEAERPDLVLMDMRMPLMNGYEATRRLKATTAGRNTPIIAVSASAHADEREKILATGADEFIRKPFRESELFDVIGRFLGIEYRYAEKKVASAKPEASAKLSPADLEELPEEIRGELRQALLALNVAAIRGSIDRICAFNGPLGEAMCRLEREYQFEMLLDLVHK
jgi:PAS domain S-box-containing protein